MWPSSCSSSCLRASSCSENSVTAVPACPALPVLPTRCTYACMAIKKLLYTRKLSLHVFKVP
jgi:hypothetical protein